MKSEWQGLEKLVKHSALAGMILAFGCNLEAQTNSSSVTTNSTFASTNSSLISTNNALISTNTPASPSTSIKPFIKKIDLGKGKSRQQYAQAVYDDVIQKDGHNVNTNSTNYRLLIGRITEDILNRNGIVDPEMFRRSALYFNKYEEISDCVRKADLDGHFKEDILLYYFKKINSMGTFNLKEEKIKIANLPKESHIVEIKKDEMIYDVLEREYGFFSTIGLNYKKELLDETLKLNPFIRHDFLENKTKEQLRKAYFLAKGDNYTHLMLLDEKKAIELINKKG